MAKILYSANDEWGITYFFKKGYKRVTSNMDKIGRFDNIEDDWIARFYYKDKNGNMFLKSKKCRELCIEINSEINFCSDDYMLSVLEEIKSLNKTKNELKKVYLKLEKIVMSKSKESQSKAV